MDKIQGIFNVGEDPKIIEVKFKVLSPVIVGVRVSDPEHENTVYFRREETFEVPGAKREWIIKLPVSPENILLEIMVSENDINSFIEVEEVEIRNYNVPNPSLNKATKEFTDLATKFSQTCGYLPLGKTYHTNNYEIDFMQFIPADDGSVHPTPARIHIDEDYIQVAKIHFDKMSVPERIAILCHEFSHNFKNEDQDSEIEADLNGARVFQELGWNDINYLYAFSKIFQQYDPSNLENLMKSDGFRFNYMIQEERLKRVENYLRKN